MKPYHHTCLLLLSLACLCVPNFLAGWPSFGKSEDSPQTEKKENSFFKGMGKGLDNMTESLSDATGKLTDVISGNDDSTQDPGSEGDATIEGMEANSTQTASLDPLAKLVVSTQEEFPNEAERLIFFMAYANFSLERANVVLMRSARDYMSSFDIPYPLIEDYTIEQVVEPKKKLFGGMFNKKSKEEDGETASEFIQVLDKPGYRKAMIEAYIGAIESTRGNVTRHQIDAVKAALVNLETARYLSLVFYTSAIPLVESLGQVKGDIEDQPLQYALKGKGYLDKIFSLKDGIQSNMKDYYIFEKELSGIESALNSTDAARIAQNELNEEALATSKGTTDGEYTETVVVADNSAWQDSIMSGIPSDSASIAGTTPEDKATEEHFVSSDESLDPDIVIVHHPIAQTPKESDLESTTGEEVEG